MNSQPLGHHSNALPTERSQHSVASLNLHDLYKVIDSGNEQSPTCEVVHETNKAHFRNLCPTDSCLVQLVEHWSDDPEVVGPNPTGGNF